MKRSYLSRQLTHKISFEFLAIFESLSGFGKTRFWQHVSAHQRVAKIGI
jgi:hypothetical protein